LALASSVPLAQDNRAVPDWFKPLLGWYHQQRRCLPWREAPTPYRVWVSEIMLQQTQVATVQPYFERFMERFPTLDALVGADLQSVLKAWEGLGYYRRARNLHRAAGRVLAEYSGRIPADVDGLRSLPGIGPYTAAAIASIAYGLPHPVVDGNVARVCARLWCIAADVRTSRVQRDLEGRLRDAISRSGDPSAFNQALMELGALVCRPRAPQCAVCPLRASCGALAAGRTAELPVRRPTTRVPHYRIAVGIIEHEGRVLIARRGEEQMLGGLWEFPGGKQERGERLVDTVVREVREEVNLAVRVVSEACSIRHAYSHFRITLTAFHCLPLGDSSTAHCDRPLAWVPWERLDDYPFPKANHKVFAALGRALSSAAPGSAHSRD
jgi:A/G-specific adenine glycosylase